MREKLLLVANVAKRLNCSSRHVYNLIRDGKLDAIRIGERGLRVTESSFAAFMDIGKVDSQSYYT